MHSTTERQPWPVCPGCEHSNTASDWSNTEHRCIDCGSTWIENPPPDMRAKVTLREPGRRARVDTLDLCRLIRCISRQEPPVEHAISLLAQGLVLAGGALRSRPDALALALLGLADEAVQHDLTEAEFVALARRAWQFARWHDRETGAQRCAKETADAMLKRVIEAAR